MLFAVALLDASVIGAFAVSLSTAYAISDVFGIRHSLHRGVMSRNPTPAPARRAQRESWRMPPLAMLRRPVMSTGRKIGMPALRLASHLAGRPLGRLIDRDNPAEADEDLSGVPESGRGWRYREFMMSASAGFHGAQPVSASSPREIRAALVGEEAGHFDREYRQVMADAAESLDLSGVLAMLERWRRVAWSTRDDPEAHRMMLDNADRLSACENIAMVPWQQVKARLGL